MIETGKTREVASQRGASNTSAGELQRLDFSCKWLLEPSMPGGIQGSVGKAISLVD